VRAFGNYAALSWEIEVLLTLAGVSIAISKKASGNSMACRSFAKTERYYQIASSLLPAPHTDKMKCLCIFTCHITPRAHDALAFM